MNPQWLGSYRQIRLIRLGSVCQVWEAVDPADDEHVAIKVLRPEQRNSLEELSTLKWEYEVGSRLRHKNIISFKTFVSSAEAPFAVLELFSELNAKMAIRRGPASIAFLVDKVFLQTSEALSCLHSKGFIHCDIKPDNILVNRNGDIKLIDFTIATKIVSGLARLFSKKPRLSGTRAYMAPEQIRQEHLDQRSDIYSLGCTFFEILTGKLPYTATSPNDLLSKHLSAPVPSASELNENVSKEFDEVLKSMMAKDRKDRPATMNEVVKAVKGMKIFNRPPELPDRSTFDDIK